MPTNKKTTSPATRGRMSAARRPSTPAIPSAFKESTAAVTAGALARAIFADPDAKSKPEDKEIPEWSTVPRLKKFCPTFSMLVGKRQGMLQALKDIQFGVDGSEKDPKPGSIKAIESDIAAALDMGLPDKLKSVRVDERRVTRVEAYNGTKTDAKEFIIALIDELIMLDLDIEAVQGAISRAKAKAIKPNNRKAHIQISDIKGEGKGEE